MQIMNSIKILIIMQALLIISRASQPCATSNTLVGCITCDASSNLVLNTTANKFVCMLNSTLSNCTLVDESGNCMQCNPGFIVSNDTVNSLSFCLALNSSFVGCKKLLNNVTCLQCISTAYNLVNGTCTSAVLNYCWKANASGCIQCSDQNIKSASNCSIPTSSCKTFDYQTWTCLACPDSTYLLHESGIFCYSSTITNCLVISISGCSQCVFGYYLDSSNLCQLDSNFKLQFELISVSYYYNSSAEMVRVCLDPSTYWNTTTSSCLSNNITSPSYCMSVNSSNSSQCTKCVQSFYSSSGNCFSCGSAYSNCLNCDSVNCFQCIPTYFLALQSNTYNISQVLAGVTTSVTKCLPCSIYNCLYCRDQYSSSGQFSVRCDKCLFGYTLHNHTCISCPSGSYFSLTSKVCVPCSVNNSMYCSAVTTIQCNAGLYFDGTACSNITTILTTQALNDKNAYEILNKSFPLSSTLIINDAKSLMTNCAASSNGFACLCTNSSNTYTSLCYSIDSNLINTSISITNFNRLSTTYSAQYLQQNYSLLLLLSQIPTFNWVYSYSTQLISNFVFANYLQITTNYIRNHLTDMSTSATSLAQLVFSLLYKTFDPYSSTVLAGAGYYFKYTPASPSSQDSTVVSVSNTTVATMVFIYFYSSTSTSLKRITGTAYVFTSQAVSDTTLQIKKINFLGNNQNYAVYCNGSVTSTSVSSDSDGFISFAVKTSTTAAASSYFVSSTTGSSLSDQFTSERIQNLIYRVAFIYILIFLTLYLTLLPFCAIFDCVDNKSQKRKIKEEEGSYQGIKHRSDTEMAEDEIALKINYKDFFPIYNIANTDRPKRFLKLCLFLVNSQHSITFLSLIYFNLPGGQPLIAVLLAIPAYLCTVIMGYLCGLLTLKLPGKLKYLINLFTIGYWILWIPVMSSFKADEYSPYVFTFAIIFFFLDMLIDFLETLLMYFTIKQESRQIKLFRALSKWLSYRGYYEFDKMAKEIDQVRDNA